MSKSRNATFISDAERLNALCMKYPGGKSGLAEAAVIARGIISRLTDPKRPLIKRRAKRSTMQDLATALRVGLHEIVDCTLEGYDGNGQPVFAEYSAQKELETMWPGLGGKGDLTEAFTGLLRLLRRSVIDIHAAPTPPKNAEPYPVEHIREFWLNTPDDGTIVEMSGSLSQFVPLISGRPLGKRKLHLNYRDESDAGGAAAPLLHSNMAVTAGQLVWRVGTIEGYQVLGLYHSIVRNSILVFVESSYFETIKGEFVGPREFACEVTVVGRVESINGFASAINVKEWKGHITAGDLDPTPPALFVDEPCGGAENKPITFKGDSRYLDGDIFALLKHDGAYRLETRFLDLSDPEDVASEGRLLEETIAKKYPGAKIESRFDNLARHKQEAGIVAPREATPQASGWRDFIRSWNPDGSDDYQYVENDELVETALSLQDEGKTSGEVDLIAASIPLKWNVAMDFGCGVGRNFSCFDKLQSSRPLLIGIDADRRRAAAARLAAMKLHNIDADILCETSRLLRHCPQAEVDHIACIQVAGHVVREELAAILQGFCRVLRTGGTCTLCIPVVGAAYIGQEASLGWLPVNDFLHAVDLDKSPFESGFRRRVDEPEFERLAERCPNRLLPVRSFLLDDFPDDAASRLPYNTTDLPRTLTETLPDQLYPTRGTLYSIHRLDRNSGLSAIGDFMVLLRKK